MSTPFDAPRSDAAVPRGGPASPITPAAPFFAATPFAPGSAQGLSPARVPGAAHGTGSAPRPRPARAATGPTRRTLGLAARRTFVVIGVIASLLGGAAAIRGAAVWTASMAVFPEPAPGISQLATQLADEQARSDSLQAQLDELVGGSTDLATALDAAGARLGTDTSTAEALRSSLAAAKARLTTLQQALAAAGVPIPTRAPAAAAPAAAPPTGDATQAPGPTAAPRLAGVPASWPAGQPIPPMPSPCVGAQLEDNGVWNCQH